MKKFRLFVFLSVLALVLAPLALSTPAYARHDDGGAQAARDDHGARGNSGDSGRDRRGHDDDPAGQKYEFGLLPQNNSGVTGEVKLFLDGNTMTVDLEADGLVPNQVHVQHIHALAGTANGTCPGPEADTDGDGIVSLQESLPFYGPVVVNFAPFPTADEDGEMHYDQVLTVDGAALEPLENRVVVVHGGLVNGTYVPSLPVACAEITLDD